MSSRTRALVMSISAPVVAFAIVGGFLGRVLAREDTYQHLKIFDDVVSLISSNYVENADIDKVMRGAMHGLADALDPDSAYLTAAQVKQVESGAALAPGGVGLELTRQYYLRVIAARDNSPAAKAGGMAWDAQGNLYVADGQGDGTGNARVAKFDKDAHFIKSWGQRGSDVGQFNSLRGIAIDAKGLVYVADGGNKRIQVFDADGNAKAQIQGVGVPAAIW